MFLFACLSIRLSKSVYSLVRVCVCVWCLLANPEGCTTLQTESQDDTAGPKDATLSLKTQLEALEHSISDMAPNSRSVLLVPAHQFFNVVLYNFMLRFALDRDKYIDNNGADKRIHDATLHRKDVLHEMLIHSKFMHIFVNHYIHPTYSETALLVEKRSDFSCIRIWLTTSPRLSSRILHLVCIASSHLMLYLEICTYPWILEHLYPGMLPVPSVIEGHLSIRDILNELVYIINFRALPGGSGPTRLLHQLHPRNKYSARM